MQYDHGLNFKFCGSTLPNEIHAEHSQNTGQVLTYVSHQLSFRNRRSYAAPSAFWNRSKECQAAPLQQKKDFRTRSVCQHGRLAAEISAVSLCNSGVQDFPLDAYEDLAAEW
jgi:hypothetical protein